MSLNNVTIVITSGFRPGYLNYALLGISRFLPECRVVVANDDGRIPQRNWSDFYKDVIWKELPRDTFLTKKRNEGVKLVDTKYTLMASDDFQFDVDLRAVIIRMTDALDHIENVDVIAGTYNDRRYEGFLEVVPGEYIRETFLDQQKIRPDIEVPAGKFWRVDIATNFFLAHTSTLKAIPWDETIGPIGGEHADWFLDLKERDAKVLWTPGLNVYEQMKDRDMEDASYKILRGRAMQGHELMLKKRGVKRYISFGESV